MGRAKINPGPAKLLPYQQKWVEDKSRLKIAEKSRQIGWTWATAYGLVRRKSLKSARMDAWISSRDEIQARLFLEDCKGFAEILHIAAKDLGELVIDEGKNSAFVLSLANGLRLHSMSSNPDAQAGKRGDRVLDEFALHPDPRKLYAIAYPGITWGGNLEIFSTHRGSTNFFNALITEIRHKGNPKKFSLHRVTLEDALNQGFLHKLQGKLPPDDERQDMDEAEYFAYIKAGAADDETFAQEYMCEPQDDKTAFISYQLLDACKYAAGYEWQEIGSGPLYLGVDVGRTTDLTVFWLVEEVGGVFFTRRVIELKNTPFSEQERYFYELMELPNLARACIDHTGIGRQFAERAQERFGYRIEPVNFTPATKEALAYPLRAALEDRNLRIPDERKIFADFRGIRKMDTAAGNIRFVGERTKDGHSDRFWAAALAIHAAKEPEGYFDPFVLDARPSRAREAVLL